VRVLVLGAGVIGVTVAESLAHSGADVHVLEMRSPGRGASQASAGILAPYVEAHEGSVLLTLGTRSLALYDDFIAGVSARSGKTIEYVRTGTLEVAQDDGEHQRLQRDRATLERLGVTNEWIDARDLPSAEPAVSASALGALLIPGHGYVGVMSLITALVASARLAGAAFETPVEAVDVSSTRDGVEVRAGARRYSADLVVIAAGSWSGRVQVKGVAPLPLRPVRGQLLHLRPGAAPMPVPRRVIWGRDCYCVPWSDRSVLVGATVEDVGFDERSTLEGVSHLTRAAAELLPATARASVEAIRVGLRPATPDDLPIIGPLPGASRVIAATGHYRNGILLAPVTAEIVTNIVLGRASDSAVAHVTPARFDTRQ